MEPELAYPSESSGIRLKPIISSSKRELCSKNLNNDSTVDNSSSAVGYSEYAGKSTELQQVSKDIAKNSSLKKRISTISKSPSTSDENHENFNVSNLSTQSVEKSSSPNPSVQANVPKCLKICPEIIPRSAWRSRKPKKDYVHMLKSVPPVLFKRTTTEECKTKEECLKAVKWMQTYHMEIYEMPDIAHSFLIGEDGNVYEGRGWGIQNEQGPGFVGIGYMGYYVWDSDNQPTRAMKRAAFRLILCGIQKGFIKNPFKKGIKTLGNGLPDPKMWDKYLLQADDEF